MTVYINGVPLEDALGADKYDEGPTARERWEAEQRHRRNRGVSTKTGGPIHGDGSKRVSSRKLKHRPKIGGHRVR